MSLWRKARAELTGAVRSVRYDMGRRPVEPPSGGPDMTSTGMNTFGVHLAEDPSVASAPAHARRTRRATAVTALGVLTVVGAAGVYLGVVNGLGSLLDGMPASADTLNPHPAVTMTFTPNSRLGRGPAATVPRTTPPAPAAGTTAGAGAAGGVGAAGDLGAASPADPANPGNPARNASPIRTTKPTKGECGCDSPPVPTPTAPASSASPSPTGDPSGTAEPSEPGDPDPSETSATPSDSAEPSHSWQDRHHRRRY